MTQHTSPSAVMITAGFAALIGIVLRIYQVGFCMDADGLILVGNPILYLLLTFAVAVIVLLAVFCSKLRSTVGCESDLCAASGYLFADLAGAVCVFYGAMQRLIDGGNLYLCIVGMEAALLLGAAALLYGKKSKVVFWLLLLSCAYYAGQLIFDFKNWSTDPLVIDFCFRLLSQVCGMLALLHISAFPISYGRRRMTVFWSACTVVFTATLLPDLLIAKTITLGELMIPLGVAIWCGSHALRLLQSEQEETPPEESAEIAETE